MIFLWGLLLANPVAFSKGADDPWLEQMLAGAMPTLGPAEAPLPIPLARDYLMPPPGVFPQSTVEAGALAEPLFTWNMGADDQLRIIRALEKIENGQERYAIATVSWGCKLYSGKSRAELIGILRQVLPENRARFLKFTTSAPFQYPLLRDHIRDMELNCRDTGINELPQVRTAMLQHVTDFLIKETHEAAKMGIIKMLGTIPNAAHQRQFAEEVSLACDHYLRGDRAYEAVCALYKAYH